MARNADPRTRLAGGTTPPDGASVDAATIIRRTGATGAPLRLPGLTPRDGKAIATWSIGLQLVCVGCWSLIRSLPAGVAHAGALVSVPLWFGALVLALASIAVAPRVARTWVALAVWIAIAGALIGLTLSSDDFGR